jgi:hypothetical protein
VILLCPGRQTRLRNLNYSIFLLQTCSSSSGNDGSGDDLGASFGVWTNVGRSRRPREGDVPQELVAECHPDAEPVPLRVSLSSPGLVRMYNDAYNVDGLA